MTPTEEITRAKYALLTTYRRDGRAVDTPVWVVGLGPDLAVWTTQDSGKVKRIRRSRRVMVARCDLRGNNVGHGYTGRATLLDPAGTESVRAEIRRKYGLAGRITLALSRLRRGLAGTVGVRIAIDSTTT